MLDRLLLHWPLKLLALALAFAIWAAVTGEHRIAQLHRVPLDVMVSEDSTLAGSPPTEVTVRLRGPEILFRDPLRLELPVDLRDASPGERSVQLSASNVTGVPRGMEVEIIEPDRLNLKLERRQRRTLPVLPSFMGKPPAGYALYGSRVIPDTLEVGGPESEVWALSRLGTDPIPLDGRTAPFTTQVNAVPESPEVRVLNPRTLQVQVEVDAAPVEVTFGSLPVALAGQVYEAAVSPSTVAATLSGPPALLGRIRPGHLRVVADVSRLAPREEPYVVPTRLELVNVPARDLARITVKSLGQGQVSVRLSPRRIRG